MKIFVTGGCGFLGSHICTTGLKRGWTPVAFDNLTKFEYSRTGYNTEEVRNYNLRLLEKANVKVVVGDITDKKQVLAAIEEYGPFDLIAHCAAQPAMTIAIDEPRLDIETNVLGTFNVLQIAKKYEIPLVNCSTIHVYGNGLNNYLVEKPSRLAHKIYGAIPEAHPLLNGTLTPLHASKRSAELYTETFAQTYGLKAANFRLTGIYGPRQFGGEDHGWVANFAIRAITGSPIKVFGTDMQVRDILSVHDAANAFYSWYKACCPPGTYNICGGRGNAISIREVLKHYEEYLNRPVVKSLEPARAGDLWWFVGSWHKAWKAFGWTPTIVPKDGLDELMDWVLQEKHLFGGSEK